MSMQLIWVGPRWSDLKGIEMEFDQHICFLGHPSTAKHTPSVPQNANRQTNLNYPKNGRQADSYYSEEMHKHVRANPNCRFQTYGALSDQLNSQFRNYLPYSNSRKMIDELNDKLITRCWLRSGVAIVDYLVIGKHQCNLDTLKGLIPEADRFVVQSMIGSGGFGTYLIDAVTPQYDTDENFLIAAPFIEDALPVNCNIVVNQNSVSQLPSSIQIISHKEGRLIYEGSDFGAFQLLSKKQKMAIDTAIATIGMALQKIGYLGFCGIDVLLDFKCSKVYFIEVNPRFQASTVALNQILLDQIGTGAQALHRKSFDDPAAKPVEASDINGFGAIYAPICNQNHLYRASDLKQQDISFKSPDQRRAPLGQQSGYIRFMSDGANADTIFENNAVRYRVISDRSLGGILPTGQYQLAPTVALLEEPLDDKFQDVQANEFERLAKLKFHLFSYGARISPRALSAIYKGADAIAVRDGIAGGIELIFFDNMHVNTPVKEFFVALSPFQLEYQGGQYFLTCEGEYVTHCNIAPQTVFHDTENVKGTALAEVGHITTDRVGLYPFRSCRYNNRNATACKFCEIGHLKPLRPVSLEAAGAAVDYIESHVPNCNHCLISGGVPPASQWHYYIDFTAAVRNKTDKPIYLMMEPPEDLQRLQDLKEAGVTEIAFNLEFFDRDLAKAAMPGKGAIPLENYVSAFQAAKSIWPTYGDVRSILIVGLESRESTMKGIDLLTTLDVCPILSPFRPVPGTGYDTLPPPRPDDLYNIWLEAEIMVKQHGGFLGPSCHACQNNTVSLPFSLVK